MRTPTTIALLVAAVLASAAVTGGDGGIIRIGDVDFPHEFHYDALELECVSCHHETNAGQLSVPHREYFEDFWHKCTSCHRENPAAGSVQACGSCHHDSPTEVADETLSAKVVVHRSCWNCHEVSTGQSASRSCKTCHAGARTDASKTETKKNAAAAGSEEER